MNFIIHFSRYTNRRKSFFRYFKKFVKEVEMDNIKYISLINY